MTCLTQEQIDLLNVHVSNCNNALKTITAKVMTKKREDIFTDVSVETQQVIALMIQIIDSQTATFYAIRNTNSAAVAA